MLSIHIRQAKAVEPQLGALALAMHLESERRHLPWCPDEVAIELGYHASQPETHCGFVAEVDGRLVGFISGCIKPFDFSSQTRLCSTFIYVAPESRGSWAFPKLLRAFEAWAITRGTYYVQIGMSGGVNSSRLEIMFAKIGYRLVGNVLAFRPISAARQNAAPQDPSISRRIKPEEGSHWENVFRTAHGFSPLSDIPFDSEVFRRTFTNFTTRETSRLYEILYNGRSVGLYGMHLHKISLCDARALKCFIVIRFPEETGERFSILRVIGEKLLDYQAASGAMEIFWLTFGAAKPRAVARALHMQSYVTLGGTFLKQLKPI